MASYSSQIAITGMCTPVYSDVQMQKTGYAACATARFDIYRPSHGARGVNADQVFCQLAVISEPLKPLLRGLRFSMAQDTRTYLQ